MSSFHPPRLAAALLRRFVPDNEPLVGDLLERFTVRPSRLWFWREVLTAIVIQLFRRTDPEHPLGLDQHSEVVPGKGALNAGPPSEISLTASPLPSLGGLGLVAIGGVVALLRPDVWWISLPAMIGGGAIGLTMVLVRRRALLSGPAKTSRTLLRRE